MTPGCCLPTGATASDLSGPSVCRCREVKRRWVGEKVGCTKAEKRWVYRPTYQGREKVGRTKAEKSWVLPRLRKGGSYQGREKVGLYCRLSGESGWRKGGSYQGREKVGLQTYMYQGREKVKRWVYRLSGEK